MYRQVHRWCPAADIIAPLAPLISILYCHGSDEGHLSASTAAGILNQYRQPNGLKVLLLRNGRPLPEVSPMGIPLPWFRVHLPVIAGTHLEAYQVLLNSRQIYQNNQPPYRRCSIKTCALYEYRMGHRPKGGEDTAEDDSEWKTLARRGFFSKEVLFMNTGFH